MVAAVVALLTTSWPSGTGLLAAVAAGATLAVAVNEADVMTWLVILAVGLGSFAFRLAPLLLFQKISLTERGDRHDPRTCGTAAITALIVVSIEEERDRRPAAVPTVLAVVAVAVVLAARARRWFACWLVRRRDLRWRGHRRGSARAMTDEVHGEELGRCRRSTSRCSVGSRSPSTVRRWPTATGRAATPRPS